MGAAGNRHIGRGDRVAHDHAPAAAAGQARGHAFEGTGVGVERDGRRGRPEIPLEGASGEEHDPGRAPGLRLHLFDEAQQPGGRSAAGRLVGDCHHMEETRVGKPIRREHRAASGDDVEGP